MIWILDREFFFLSLSLSSSIIIIAYHWHYAEWFMISKVSILISADIINIWINIWIDFIYKHCLNTSCIQLSQPSGSVMKSVNSHDNFSILITSCIRVWWRFFQNLLLDFVVLYTWDHFILSDSSINTLSELNYVSINEINFCNNFSILIISHIRIWWRLFQNLLLNYKKIWERLFWNLLLNFVVLYTCDHSLFFLTQVSILSWNWIMYWSMKSISAMRDSEKDFFRFFY